MNSYLITDETGGSSWQVMWVKKWSDGCKMTDGTTFSLLDCLVVAAAERGEDVTFATDWMWSHGKASPSAWTGSIRDWLAVSALWPLPGQMWRHRADCASTPPPQRGVDQNKASIALSGTCHILLPTALLCMKQKKKKKKRREMHGSGEALPLCGSKIKGSRQLSLHVKAMLASSVRSCPAVWLYTLKGAKQQQRKPRITWKSKLKPRWLS